MKEYYTMNEIPTVIYNEKKKKRTPLNRWMKLSRVILSGGILAALLLLLALEQAAPKIDVTGVWVGKVVQDPGGIFANYPFELTLHQDDGQISGTSYIRLPDMPDQYGVISIKGSVQGEVVYLHESAILEQILNPEWRWCLKDIELRLHDNILSGDWTAPGCLPGHMELTLAADGQ